MVTPTEKMDAGAPPPLPTALTTSTLAGSSDAALDTAPGAPIRYTRREGHVLRVDDVNSARMAEVRQKGTKPELVVRSLLASLGHRFRVGRRGLQGSPDIVNVRRRWVVFVHGCFWHRHGCKASTTPKNNRDFWQAKFARNVERDKRCIEALEALGYRVIVVWECETKRDVETLRQRLARELATAPSSTR